MESGIGRKGEEQKGEGETDRKDTQREREGMSVVDI